MYCSCISWPTQVYNNYYYFFSWPRRFHKMDLPSWEGMGGRGRWRWRKKINNSSQLFLTRIERSLSIPTSSITHALWLPHGTFSITITSSFCRWSILFRPVQQTFNSTCGIAVLLSTCTQYRQKVDVRSKYKYKRSTSKKRAKMKK